MTAAAPRDGARAARLPLRPCRQFGERGGRPQVADGAVPRPTDAGAVVRDGSRQFDQRPELEDDHGVTLADYWPVRERHAIEYQRRVIEAGDKPLYDDVAAIETLDATLAVVSNNQQQTVDALVERHEISDLFEHVCGREPTLAAMDRRKPDPHLIETTLEAIEASNALYVGDKHSDVVAAARAGIDSAFLRRSHCRDVTLDRTPTYEVETLRELVDELAVSEEQ